MSDIPGIHNDNHFRKIMDMMTEYGFGMVVLVFADHKVMNILPAPSIRSGTLDLSNLRDIANLTLKQSNPRSATGGSFYIPKDQ
jgi:hypothetical protein